VSHATGLSRDLTQDLLADLCAAFGQPYGTDAAASSRLVDVWSRALVDVEPGDARRACDEYVRTGRRFPAPEAIRSRALELRRQRAARDEARRRQDQSEECCPRCHSATLIELVNGRLRPLHADNCPGLHAEDLLEQRAALEAGTPTYQYGACPMTPHPKFERRELFARRDDGRFNGGYSGE
jgi:hypothetical protein